MIQRRLIEPVLVNRERLSASLTCCLDWLCVRYFRGHLKKVSVG